MGKISDIKLPILKPENYTEWKIKVTSLLKSRELFDLVEKDPDNTTQLKEDYVQSNEEAKTIIYSSLDGKTTQTCGVCETAHSLWNKVIGYHEGLKDDISGLAISRFMEMTKETDEQIVDFLGRYEIALNNLKSTGFQITFALMVYVLCKSMPQNIKDGVRVWRTINVEEKVESIDKLLSFIRANYREEETKRDANKAALLGYSKYKNRRNKEYKSSKSGIEGNIIKGEKSKVTCTYCKKNGHGWQNCYKLKNDNEKKGRNAKHRANMAVETSYLLYQQYLPKEISSNWIIDSGATTHMTYKVENLQNYEELMEPLEVQIGDGEVIFATGKGWVFFHGRNGALVLKNVLYVPEMVANLFSVKAALSDGYEIKFDRNGVVVKHQNELIKSYYDGVLFSISLNILHHQRINSGFIAHTIEQWHKKFGHCGENLIRRMKELNMVDGLEIGVTKNRCIDCLESKARRTSHPSRTAIKADDKLAIIHFDTVDMTVKSIGGRRYFVLGTEEYSGYKVIDFVAEKSNISSSVKLIINSVSLNSKRPVACIYSDNGTEFVNKDLREWLENKGIIHELSSPYNAEQNGRAEASNKAVINAARTALVSSGLPKALWAEACVNSFTYL